MKIKLFDTWKQIDFQRQRIRMLWGFIAILVFVNVLLWRGIVGIQGQLQHQRVYVTPASVVQGGYHRLNMIPNAFVAGFAYQLFVAINTWSENARKDYKNNIFRYRFYLTPTYRQALLKDFNARDNSGNLFDSIQTLAPYHDKDAVSGMQVKRVSEGSWIVRLSLRVTRYKNGSVLMDALYTYQVRVVQTAQSIQYNPWGLALAGLVSKTRVKTFI